MEIVLSMPYKPLRIGGSDKFLSWIELADDPDRIEIIYAMDSDNILMPRWCDIPESTVLPCESYGSSNLHKYHNEVAKRVDAKYYQILADDCEMLTKGWDSILMENDYLIGQIGGSYAYPSVNRKIVDCLGYLARHTVDAYLRYLGRGITTSFPNIKFKQHTDDNEDPNRNSVNQSISKSFHSDETRLMIEEDKEKIREMLS